MTGHGGWPLNVFLTPEQVPFYAGTYFPPEDRGGHAELAPDARGGGRGVGRSKRDEIRAGSRSRRRAPARRRGARAVDGADRPARARRRRRRRSRRTTTRVHGGFGGAPKFPPASALEFLLRRGETEMTTHTLRAMASGGMYDQVGGGFARYSVDAALARAPLREDALRQRAARARVPARLAGDRRAALPRASARRRSTGRCARCAAPRAASTPRSTPTPRASRASSTSGRSRSCASRPATRRSLASAPPTEGNFEGRNILVRAGEASPTSSTRRTALRGARRSASGRASTTSG